VISWFQSLLLIKWVNLYRYVVARLANKHPGKDIIGCREALISTNNVINSGTLLLRNTPWTAGAYHVLTIVLVCKRLISAVSKPLYYY
jgi:hypothetical protein